MAGSFVDFQVLYSDGPPTSPIRLGQLLVDESEASPALMLKYCASLSPLTYTSFLPSGGAAPADETYLTVANESGTLPNSRRVLAGTNITFDDTVANVRTVNVAAFPAGANPTASVGLTAVNGSATTFLRSDGAPALSQAIAPTWSAGHIWTAGADFRGTPNVLLQGVVASPNPNIVWIESDAATDEGRWDIIAASAAGSGQLRFRALNDDGTVGTVWGLVGRTTGSTVDALNFTATAVSVTGTFATSGNVGFNGATPAARPDYTVTNPTTDRALNVTGDTLAQVAQVLGTLIADLIAIGLLQ